MQHIQRLTCSADITAQHPIKSCYSSGLRHDHRPVCTQYPVKTESMLPSDHVEASTPCKLPDCEGRKLCAHLKGSSWCAATAAQLIASTWIYQANSFDKTAAASASAGSAPCSVVWYRLTPTSWRPCQQVSCKRQQSIYTIDSNKPAAAHLMHSCH